MGVVGLTGKEFDRLIEVSREMSKSGWLQQFGVSVPPQVRTLVDHEDRAVAIRGFDQTFVPGLLQTPTYARAVMCQNPNVPLEEVEDRVQARLARRQILSRAPQIKFTFFVHEFVVRLPVGGPTTMSEQLHHMLQMSVRPSISLRIVPRARGAHAGMSGAFRLMEFADVRPVVYLENETSGLFVEEAAETTAYRTILAALAKVALGDAESRELIADLATHLYSAEGDHDDLAQEQLQWRQW
jgi:hypothetical protein